MFTPMPCTATARCRSIRTATCISSSHGTSSSSPLPSAGRALSPATSMTMLATHQVRLSTPPTTTEASAAGEIRDRAGAPVLSLVSSMGRH